MIEQLKIFFRSSLIKASYFNLIIVSVKVLSGFILSKVFAVLLGPSGYAFIGNFQNLSKLATAFTAEGYQNGVIRFTSQYSEVPIKLKKIRATIYQISLVFSIIVGVVLFVFSHYWSELIFQTKEYHHVIKCLAVGLPFISFNLITIYVLNGLQKYKKLAFVNSVLSVVGMLVGIGLCYVYDLAGGLISFSIGPVIVFLIVVFFLFKDRYLLFDIFNIKWFSTAFLKKANLYFFMAAYGMVISYGNLIAIRTLIISQQGILEAGYWEAMNRISTYYLMFFLSLTSIYLLPQFSKTNSVKRFKREIKSFYSLVIPVLAVFFIGIYLFRFLLLKLLLSKAFMPTANLFFWQLVGDSISVLAIALVKQFHAKLMVKAYVICNGVLNLMYFCLSYLFIQDYGIVGVTKAYALSYAIYLLMVFGFVLHYFKKNVAD
ncbi:O-antigen translocase [Aestuariibaculum sediminum]|uniref:O-antigen translocase n=1 Tax=Aestuariibaculum sediminum TaxID=2770637 RepID=A0A8J6PXB3_9FLAO|nr:O-antigen translocase [Aestuariibaculum sediminum]MBD0830557.1 O-antigen translocase [Aestuariibaculum sediminum]